MADPRFGLMFSEDEIAGGIAFVRCLQLSDSALPIGRYVHSLGLEALLDSDPGITAEGLAEVVQSYVSQGVAPLDAVAVCEAHRRHAGGDVAGLVALDRALTVRKLSPAARRASQTCGGQLSVLARSVANDPVLDSYCGAVRDGMSDGNLAVVEGALAGAMKLPIAWAVMIELRGSAAGLLSAAVRLGRLSATRAQQLLSECELVIAQAAGEALSCSVDEMWSSAIELEIHAMRHARAESKLFMT